MSPKIETEIMSLIEAAKNAGGNFSTFIADQAPEVIEQLVRWKIYEGLVDLTVGIALIVGGVKFFQLCWKKHKAKEIEECVWFPCGICVLLMMGIGFGGAYSGFTQVGKATLSPKVLILETMADLAKGE